MIGEFTSEALDATEAQVKPLIYVRAVAATITAYSMLGRWAEAEDLGMKALTVLQGSSDNSLISWVARTLVLPCNYKGNHDRAIEYAELAVQKATAPADKTLAEALRAWTWCRAGDPSRGLDVLASAVQMTRASRYVVAELAMLSCLNEGYVLAGEYNQARQTAEELLELSERSGARAYTGWAHSYLAEVALQTEPDKAGRHFEKAISIFQQSKAENELALAYSGMSRYHKQQGDTEQAREYLTKALEIFERLGTLIEPDKVREELAELPQ